MNRYVGVAVRDLPGQLAGRHYNVRDQQVDVGLGGINQP